MSVGSEAQKFSIKQVYKGQMFQVLALIRANDDGLTLQMSALLSFCGGN